METIYEMIQEGDEALIKLMMEAEKMHGDVEVDINEWVEQTTAVLQEQLSIDPLDEKVPEVITEENINMLKLANVLTEGVDKDAARELEVFIDNDGQLYNQQYLPILKNLSKKSKKGKYDKKLAVKLWMYLVDNGAKKYFKDNKGMGKWNDMFNKATRIVVAQELEKMNREEIEMGNYL